MPIKSATNNMRRIESAADRRWFRAIPGLLAFLLCVVRSTAQLPDPSVVDSLDRIFHSAVPAGRMIVVDQGQLKALFNGRGRPVTLFAYTSIREGLGGNFIACGYQGCRLLDSAGHEGPRFEKGVRGVDRMLRSYTGGEEGMVVRYDTAARETERTYIQESERRLPYYRWQSGRGTYGVKDTSGRVILPDIFEEPMYLSLSSILALRNDTAFVYDTTGRLRFQFRAAQSYRLLPRGVVAVQRFGLWGLKDSNGHELAPFRYGGIAEQVSDRAILMDQDLLDYTGRQVVDAAVSGIVPRPGGWLEILYRKGLRELRDDSLKVMASLEGYEYSSMIGTRFVRFSKGYFDKEHLIYDLRQRRFTSYPVEDDLGHDAYLLNDGLSNERRILKGDALLRLPCFNAFERKWNFPFTEITDDGPYEGKYRELQRSYGWEYRDEHYLAAKIRSGLLDTAMRLIVPLAASLIQPLGCNLVYAFQPADSAGYVYNGSGTLMYRVPGLVMPERDGAVIRFSGSAGILISDTDGHILYRGREQPQLLYPAAGDEHQTALPALLLYDDTTGYSGLYDLGGRNLLPHRYYAVAQRIPGLFSLKSGDSIYFANTKGRLMYGGRGFAGRHYFPLESYAMLMRDRNGKWGVLGADGRELQPFEFDSMTLVPDPIMGKPRYALARKGLYALLGNTGELRYDPQPWRPVRAIGDSYCRGDDANDYRIAGGRALRVPPGEDPGDPRLSNVLQSWDAFLVAGPGRYDLPAGIYNRRLKRVAAFYPGFGYPQSAHVIAVTDSQLKQVRIIDTSGAGIIPAVKAPVGILGDDSTYIFLYPDRRDLLFHFENGRFAGREIRIDSIDRPAVLQDVQTTRLGYIRSFSFRTGDGGCGISGENGALILDPGLRVVQAEDLFYLARRKGRYGLVDRRSLRYIQPPDADTILVNSGSRSCLIVRRGRRGYYDGDMRLYLPPVFEAVYPEVSPGSGFVLAKDAGGFAIYDTDGLRVSPFADSIGVAPGSLAQLVAFENGREASFAIAEDGNIRLEEGPSARVRREGLVGSGGRTAIVPEGEKLGLYNNGSYRMVLPASYDAIEGRGEFGFVAWRYYPDRHRGIDSTILADEEGRPICAMKGGFNPVISNNIWFAGGTDRSPLLSRSGRMILPAGYRLSRLINDRFFIATGKGGSGIIDADGNWLLAPELDRISDERGAFQEYLIGMVSKGETEKYLLIGAKGQALTGALYDDIRLGASGVLFRRGRIHGYLEADGRERRGAWLEDEHDDD